MRGSEGARTLVGGREGYAVVYHDCNGKKGSKRKARTTAGGKERKKRGKRRKKRGKNEERREKRGLGKKKNLNFR